MILAQPLDVLLITAIAVPFFSFLIRKDKRSLWLRDFFIISGILVAFYFLINFTPLETNLLKADSLSFYFSFIFLIFGLLITIYSFREKKDSKFYSLLLFTLSGLVGLTFASNFFTFFVFWELMLISSYPLVYYGEKKGSVTEAGLKYLFMSVAGAASLLFAISLLYGLTGTVSFAKLSRLLPETPFLKIIITLIIAGFGVESVIFPFHFWAPDVYQVSKTSISAFFASLLSKSGIFGLIRVFYLLFPSALWSKSIVILSLISMTFGNLMALTQGDLRRLLAFSSISHLSFILFAISLGTRQGLVAGLFHTLNHAILMSSLFFCLGTFSSASLQKLKGICRKLSVSRTSFLISCLAAGGLPPFNGFISELLILLAGIGKGWLVFSGVLLFNIFLGLVVFLRVVKNSLEEGKKLKVKKCVLAIVPILILACLILVIGIYPSPILDILWKVVAKMGKV